MHCIIIIILDNIRLLLFLILHKRLNTDIVSYQILIFVKYYKYYRARFIIYKDIELITFSFRTFLIKQDDCCSVRPSWIKIWEFNENKIRDFAVKEGSTTFLIL